MPTESSVAPATAEDLVKRAAERLGRTGVEQPRSEALLLLARVLGVTKTELLAHPEREVGPGDNEQFAKLVERRATREPFAYVVGEREFYGQRFVVDPRVLIPRPETEILVEAALGVLAGRSGRPLVIDVGTGSGAIACTLALHAPLARVVGADLSADALGVAAENRRRLGLDERVWLVRGDLLDWLATPADLIVANLPYLPTDRISRLEPEVAAFEPVLALDGGPDGADLLRRLVRSAPDVLRPGGVLLLELDPDQVGLMRAEAPWREGAMRVIEDLAGLPRVLRIDVPT